MFRNWRVTIGFSALILGSVFLLSQLGTDIFDYRAMWTRSRSLASNDSRATIGSENLIGELANTTFEELVRIHIQPSDLGGIAGDGALARYVLSDEGILCPQFLAPRDLRGFEFLSFSTENSGCLDLRIARNGVTLQSEYTPDPDTASQGRGEVVETRLTIEDANTEKSGRINEILGSMSFYLRFKQGNAWYASQFNLPIKIDRYASGYWRLNTLSPNRPNQFILTKELSLEFQVEKNKGPLSASEGVTLVPVRIFLK